MRASASKTGLLLRCQYWARDDVKLPPDKPSAAAKCGTKVHALIAAFVNQHKYPDIDNDPDDWAMRRALDGIKLVKMHHGASAEITYAMHPTEGTIPLGADVARDEYPPVAFCGTADIIWADDAEIASIRDWKTGSPSDAEEWQLRALAAMATECGEAVRDAKAIYLTDGGPRFSRDYIEGTDPKEDAATIRRHLAMIPESAPNPGHWCKSYWCGLRSVCPAQPKG